MKTAALVLIAGILPGCIGQSQCKENPKVIAACYVVHGRLTLGADTIRLRIWPVGTARMLGVTGGPIPDDADAPIAPKSLSFGPEAYPIYGDFKVCPFTPERKGEMQMVCIESATHLILAKH